MHPLEGVAPLGALNIVRIAELSGPPRGRPKSRIGVIAFGTGACTGSPSGKGKILVRDRRQETGYKTGANRNTYNIGLHRDSEAIGISEFDRKMRRRLRCILIRQIGKYLNVTFATPMLDR